jgi:ATP-dependent helicase/nuclease subunit A
MPAIEPDTRLTLPRVTVLKASAGSGKTFALTERYVQFLLSSVVPRNDLRNILAITFSNNASREMRENVLGWLKLLHFRDPLRLAEIASVTAGGAERAASRAGALIDEILSRYSDFQVRTIDSFMAMIFRASALDFGFSPEFQIVMDAAPLVDYAYNVFLREARADSDNARILDETIRAVLGFKAADESYPWDPSGPLLAEIQKLEARLSMLEVEPGLVDMGPRMEALEKRILEAMERLRGQVDASGLEESARSTFRDGLARAQAGRFADLIGRGMKSCPVNKPPARDAVKQARYQEIKASWEETASLVRQYVSYWARAYYQPALRLRAALASVVNGVKRNQGKVFIGDINRALGGYLTRDMVPDIYFRLGERIWHFLIDEFQDTSPLQWRNIFPLVENSLAAGGSLFVVGDTKQAIYGFRQADYTIMRSLEEENPFPSAGHSLAELDTNWRSRPRILEFISQVFQRNATATPEYREAARRSGLDSWTQKALPGTEPGYVEVARLERDDEDPPEKAKLAEIMGDLRRRGYRWGDVALLASRNDQIIRATSWLNEMRVPFISLSSLDVRRRGIAAEVLALLAFLDSPPDDLAFATFLLGEVFSRTLVTRHGWKDAAPLRELLFRLRAERPLYKAFQREWPAIWDAHFAGLFRSAGYLPLYDLVSEAYASFDAFALAGAEEATLAKLLETVKVFEGSGSNSLREFLSQAGAEGGEWAIDVPRGADSVRAMTVHKAKGLGFPVVVVLLYGESSKGFPYALLREEEAVGLVKITRAIAGHDPVLEALYDEEAIREKGERLNGLYVALTRAKAEMYVLAVKRERDTFPFDLLPDDPLTVMGEKPAGAQPGAEEKDAAAVPLSHETRPAPVAFGGGGLHLEERRRGELVHRILELVEYAEGDAEAVLAAAAARAAALSREDPTDSARAARVVSRMLADARLAPFFARAPGRLVLREQELCSADGRLFRIDRLVVDPDRVTVLDWKTGAEEPAAHAAQMEGYRKLLSEVYPGKPVESLVAYMDLDIVRKLG